MTLAQTDPADACGQALKRNARTRLVEPALKMRIFREQFLHHRIGLVDVFRIAAERHPAERPLAPTKERSDVRRHEARKIEGVLDPLVERHLPDVVAVVDGWHAHRMEVEHRLHVHRAAVGSSVAHLGMLTGIGLSQAPTLHGPAQGQIAIDEIMCRSLIRHEVGANASSLGAAHQLWHDVRRVAQQSDRDRFLFASIALEASQSVVAILGLFVEVARLHAEVDARLLAFDVQ